MLSTASAQLRINLFRTMLRIPGCPLSKLSPTPYGRTTRLNVALHDKEGLPSSGLAAASDQIVGSRTERRALERLVLLAKHASVWFQVQLGARDRTIVNRDCHSTGLVRVRWGFGGRFGKKLLRGPGVFNFDCDNHKTARNPNSPQNVLSRARHSAFSAG